MENKNLTPEETPEEDSFDREDRCRKAMKTVSKAIFMRLFVMALLIWAMLQADMELWVIGIIALVLVINLSGMLPLWAELKKRRKELKEILAEEE